MRIAIIADTHGFLDPRIAEIAADCDLAVHAGDIGGADVLLALKPRDHVVAVRGNNDVPEKWSAHEVHLLDTLPTEAVVDLPGGQLVVVHGDAAGAPGGRHEQLRQRYSYARAVAYGHSHQASVDDSALPWILNPGAAGRTRTYGGPSCLLLTCGDDRWDVELQQLPPRKYRAL
jgi:putative phosphoesterase